MPTRPGRSALSSLQNWLPAAACLTTATGRKPPLFALLELPHRERLGEVIRPQVRMIAVNRFENAQIEFSGSVSKRFGVDPKMLWIDTVFQFRGGCEEISESEIDPLVELDGDVLVDLCHGGYPNPSRSKITDGASSAMGRERSSLSLARSPQRLMPNLTRCCSRSVLMYEASAVDTRRVIDL